jgi:hypothetical protein
MTYNLSADFELERDLDFTPVDPGDPGLNLPGVKTIAMQEAIDTNGSVVSGNFTGEFNGGGYMISNLTISAPNTPANGQYVGLFRQIYTGGTVRGLTMFFDDEQAVISSEYANANIGIIAGRNYGRIRDIAVVSSAYERIEEPGDDPDIYNTVQPVNSPHMNTTAYVGGITGVNESSGTIRRVLYIAPAPIHEDVAYPVTRDNKGTITDAYYLSGDSDVEIIIPHGSDVVITDDEYNFTPVAAEHGVPFNLTTLEIPDPVPDVDDLGSRWSDDDGGSIIYPYPYLIISATSQSLPTSWPQVTGDVPELICGECETHPCICCEDCDKDPCECPCEDCGLFPCECPDANHGEYPCEDCNEYPCVCPCEECTEYPCVCPCSSCGNTSCTCNNDGSGDSSCDCGECEDCLNNDGEPDEGGEPNEPNDSGEPDESSNNGDDNGDSSESIDTVAAGAITLVGGFGGFGLTRSQKFKAFMKKSNARAIRRINEYNSKLGNR